MPVPEEWKSFITASTTKQDGQAQGRVASAGTESIMFSSNRQPHVGNPLAAEVPSAATPIRNDRANAREKAAQIQAERRTKEEAVEAALRAERVKKGKPTLSDLLFHTNYSTSNGLETLPETAKHYYNVGEQWVKDNPADSAALALSPVPIVGDVAGVAADIHHYYQNPDDLTWQNLSLSALGLVPWVPHGAAMVKSVKGLRHDLDLLAKGGQEAVIVGKLSDEQVRQLLKIVPPEAGEAFLLTDKMLRATPNLVEHLIDRRPHEMEYLLQQLPNFPSKAAVHPNVDPSRQHRPTFLLYNAEIDKYIIFVIDTTAKKGELVPITTHIAKEKDRRKLENALQNMKQ
jgi:hypothetical protein